VAALQRFFRGYRSRDEYDRNAITHVMACSALLPGALLASWRPVAPSEGRLGSRA
jgi:hypothetical protein